MLNIGTANALDLIILCTSLSFIDRVAARKLIEDRLPKVKVLTLIKSGEPMGSEQNHMFTLDGPSKLVKKTRELTKD